MVVRLRFNFFRPGNDTGRDDTSFMQISFIFLKRGIGYISPGCIISHIRTTRSNFGLGVMEISLGYIFRTGAIIGDKDYQRIIPLTIGFQLFHQSTDILIHPINHGGIYGHFANPFFLIIYFFPGGYIFRSWEVSKSLIDYTQSFHPLEPTFTDYIPTLFIEVEVLLYIRLGGM